MHFYIHKRGNIALKGAVWTCLDLRPGFGKDSRGGVLGSWGYRSLFRQG